MKKLAFMMALITASLALTSCTTIVKEKPFEPNYKAAADTNIQVGMLLLKKGDTELAKASFLRALRQAPKRPESSYALAYFYEQTGKPKEAEQYFRQAIYYAPRSGDAHNNYGTFLCRQKKYDSALNQFLIAAREPSYTNTAEAYENAGLCELARARKKSALSYFKMAVESSPSRSTSLYEMSQIYKKQGKQKLARYYLSQYKKVQQANSIGML